MIVNYTTFFFNKHKIIIAQSNSTLVYCGFSFDDFQTRFPNNKKHTCSFLMEVKNQLEEYFLGHRESFDIKASFSGTEFQKEIWKEIKNIPYGELTTYGELAEKLGRGNAQRAVGAGLGRNPIAIIYPCHRVVGKNGSLTGFAGGVELKKNLLTLEGVSI